MAPVNFRGPGHIKPTADSGDVAVSKPSRSIWNEARPRFTRSAGVLADANCVLVTDFIKRYCSSKCWDMVMPSTVPDDHGDIDLNKSFFLFSRLAAREFSICRLHGYNRKLAGSIMNRLFLLHSCSWRSLQAGVLKQGKRFAMLWCLAGAKALCVFMPRE
jgi:hypothetical protein